MPDALSLVSGVDTPPRDASVARAIGDDVDIRHSAALGVPNRNDPDGKPIIGDRVDIGAGPCLRGAVAVGHDVIGANFEGREYPSLHPPYTDGGGHSNASGQRVPRAAMVRLVAEALKGRRQVR